MMSSPDRQIHFRPRVILTFDLPTPKVDRFMPLLRGPRVPICIKIGSFFFKFGNWRMNERTDERKDRLRTLPLRLPVWHGGCKKCLSVMLLRPHFIILASCKPVIGKLAVDGRWAVTFGVQWPSTVSVRTSYYSMWQYNCLWIIKG